MGQYPSERLTQLLVVVVALHQPDIVMGLQ
jgi:hypothetical protein